MLLTQFVSRSIEHIWNKFAANCRIANITPAMGGTDATTLSA